MIKNLLVYTIPAATNLEALTDEAASKFEFAPCSASADKSSGWVPPRGQEHGALIERVNGHWILAMLNEIKRVPGDALKRALEEKCKHIESSTGRKPGKKAKRELKEEIRQELIAKVLPSRAKTLVWIDPATRLLCIDATSAAKADDVLTLLVKAFDGFCVEPLATKKSPSTAMAVWLTQTISGESEFPCNLAPGKSLDLAAADESQARVRFTKHHILTDEVRQHLAQGKVPMQMAMGWDDRVSFVLTDRLGIRKIEFQDSVLENQNNNADEFDGSVVLFTSELSKMISDLIEALEGKDQQ